MKPLSLTLSLFASIKILVCILAFVAMISVSYAQGTGKLVVSTKVEQNFSPGADIYFPYIGQYYTANVSVKNTTSAAANLCGWIDWNNNGTFEAGEGVCKTLTRGRIGTNLVWPTATLGGSVGSSGVYARFRLMTGALIAGSAKGAADDGEVEDYFVAFVNPLPVKLTTFEGFVHEQNVALTWTTTQETNADRFEIEHSLDGKV